MHLILIVNVILFEPTMDELENIRNKIYEIRGQRVILDRDIAIFYGVETKRLNEKVKRNPKRFAGDDFMFQLTPEEFEQVRLRSQFATLNKRRGTLSKYLPHAFTLLGVSMLSSVLESDSAIEANRRIMRAFVTYERKNNRKTKFIWEMMGKSTVATGGKAGTFRVKDRFFQGESGVVIGIAADGAVISSGRC